MKETKIYTILIFSMLAGFYLAGGFSPEWPLPWIRGALIFILIFSGAGTNAVAGGTFLALFGEGIAMLPVISLALPFLVTAAVLSIAGRFIEFLPVSGRSGQLSGFFRATFVFLVLNVVFTLSAVMISGDNGQIRNIKDAVSFVRFSGGLILVYTIYVLSVFPVIYKRDDT